MNQRILIIAGPTASGKSARAIETARVNNGVIINADSMQLYKELRIVTARPSAEEESLAPHRLYGVWPGDDPSSAGKWVAAVAEEIRAAWKEKKLPIIVGGTGLYLKTLVEGISPMPDIPPDVQQFMRGWVNANDTEVAYAELQAQDAAMAKTLKAGDTQRITRALEVLKATGKSLLYWQSLPPEKPFPDAEIAVEKIEIARDELYARCDVRFLTMLEQGALAEVEALLALNYAPDLPVMRAVGVPELSAYLQGKQSLEESIAQAQQATRNYAKRQMTWLRNQKL